MIQLIVNSQLLRELDERKLINAYAHYMYNKPEDVNNDFLIKENLIQLLDWDENGDSGLGIYCGKFESLKKKDWIKLISFIKENWFEIKSLASSSIKERKLEHIKKIKSFTEKKEEHKKEYFTKENYESSNRGKKAIPCVYKGRKYKSRQECMYKEGITQNQLYRYLEKTNQV